VNQTCYLGWTLFSFHFTKLLRLLSKVLINDKNIKVVSDVRIFHATGLVEIKEYHQGFDRLFKQCWGFSLVRRQDSLPATPSLVMSPAPESTLSSSTVTFELYTGEHELSSWDEFRLTRTREFTNTLFYFNECRGIPHP